VAGFVVVVVAFGRWQGVRALLGLVASGLILVAFVVPALLRDEPALLVALAGTVAVAFVAIYLAHGLSTASTVALAGTIVSLVITTVLAFLAAGATSLTGLTDENAQTLRVTAQALDLRGLLVARSPPSEPCAAPTPGCRPSSSTAKPPGSAATTWHPRSTR
jgi:uncharacterized membrane protein